MADPTPQAPVAAPGPIEAWFIARIEKRWPGAKDVIDQFAGKVPWDLLNGLILLAVERFVPGGPAFLDILRGLLADPPADNPHADPVTPPAPAPVTPPNPAPDVPAAS